MPAREAARSNLSEFQIDSINEQIKRKQAMQQEDQTDSNEESVNEDSDGYNQFYQRYDNEEQKVNERIIIHTFAQPSNR